jgi:CheY-like chemotaxis protein
VNAVKRLNRGLAMRLEEATILIADDEPILREVCALWLKEGGCCEVLTASDGREALGYIEVRKVDILIADIHMPKMDGVVLIRTIRERGFSIPAIIFMSAYLDVDLREMTNLGVKEFLQKPFTAETLLEIVAARLSGDFGR